MNSSKKIEKMYFRNVNVIKFRKLVTSKNISVLIKLYKFIKLYVIRVKIIFLLHAFRTVYIIHICI